MATLRFQRQRRSRRAFFVFLFIVCFLTIYAWTWGYAASYYVETSKSWMESKSPLREWWAPSLIDTNNRSFIFDPITAEESEILTQKDKSGMTAAVCHRTLFGSITLDPLFAFASYYRLLGFDHIFLWYRPKVANLARFEELSSLPYVTMTEYTGGGRDHGQLVVEEECLSNSTYAADYNWALTIDADEFLWLNSPMTIKDFLSIYNSNYTFLSFGKWMYTTMQGVRADQDSGFGVDELAFTAKSHCKYNFSARNSASSYSKYMYFPREMTYSYCPSYRGRSKVIVKPVYHKKVNIHGMNFDLRKPGMLHFDTSIAHLKEWRGNLMKRRGADKYRPPVDFKVWKNESVGMIDFHRAHKIVDGHILMHYDSELQDWMSFVASGCSK